MATPPPVVVPSREICRVTIEGPKGRADLALPVSTPLAELLPALLPHVVPDPADRGTTPWVLQRLGEAPLAIDGTPETLGLRHGDLLYLRPEEQPLAALHFDDIADGVAHTVNNQPGRWRPELTSRFALALASLTLAALVLTVLRAGPGSVTGAVCLVISVFLAVGAAAAMREQAGRAVVLTAALWACVFAGAAGLALRRGAGDGFDLGARSAAMALGALAVMASMLLGVGALPITLAGTLVSVAAVGAVGIALFVALHLDPAQAAGLVAVAMFVVGHFSSNLALRLAQLRVPHLPHDARELQEDIDPEPEERIALRVRAAAAYLDILSLTCAASYAVAFWLLVGHRGWIGWVLPVVLSCAVVLHSRDRTGVMQRVPAVLVGAFGIGLVLIERAAGDGPVGWSVVSGVLLVGAVLMVVGAWRLPTSRLRPLWGQIGDTVEMLSAVAVLPLLLQLLHVYAFFRALAG